MSVTSAGGSPSSSTTVSVTVNALPIASISPLSATLTCASQSVSLTASGGSAYRWENSATNAIRTVSSAGTYSVTVTSANGCTATISRTITSNMSLTATAGASSITALVGNVVSLTASGGSTYQWLAPTGASLSSPVTASSVSATLTTTGPKIFTVVVSQGSCSQTLTVGVTAIDLPDLASLLYTLPATAYGTTNVSVVVDVVEVNDITTSGLITLRIAKDPRLVLNWSPTASLVGNQLVQNSLWSFNGTDPDVYILTTNQRIAGGDKLSIGLTGVLSPGTTRGVLTVSAVVVGGGEIKTTNNIDADRIEYFNK